MGCSQDWQKLYLILQASPLKSFGPELRIIPMDPAKEKKWSYNRRVIPYDKSRLIHIVVGNRVNAGSRG